MSRNESLVSEILSVKWREVRYKVNIVFQFLAATTCDSPDPMTSLYPLCSWGAKLWYCLAHDHWSWTARRKLMVIKFAPSLQHSQWDEPDKHEIDTCERDKNIGLLLTSKFIQSSLDYGSFFREFSPENQHCYAQNLGIDYSGWTDLINGGIFFSSVLLPSESWKAPLNGGTHQRHLWVCPPFHQKHWEYKTLIYTTSYFERANALFMLSFPRIL